ncbi:MAG: hypothetical protein A3E87_00385 [Gammaproteobacteria bacterium RIFCSPHIGHO2_12_FULL_35_23]|nr:MAG: hypothetical protein A3E87_00385 [Gammaproteobacteria bacterium RIFCSPHIGHO2_12_FULL_35_23]
MNKVFFISDTHFGHKNIIVFEAIKKYRPFQTITEHDNKLIDNWNSVVNEKDTVWHLGDFCFGKTNLAIAGKLNGIKKLVKGNHDIYPTKEYLKYFTEVYGVVEYKRFILSHIPVHPQQFIRYKANIHGHLHDKTLDDPRYINVSCEQINLTPILFDELIHKVI